MHQKLHLKKESKQKSEDGKIKSLYTQAKLGEDLVVIIPNTKKGYKRMENEMGIVYWKHFVRTQNKWFWWKMIERTWCETTES